MKLLAIIGSPRKNGLCKKMVELVAERFRQSGPVELDTLFIGDLELEMCKGCCVCILRDERACPKAATVQAVLARMEACDCILFASPVYAHQVSALAKNLIDHLAFMVHRPRFINKPAIAIAATDGSGLQETLGYLRLILSGWGFSLVGELGGIGLAYRFSEPYRKQLTRLVDASSKRAARIMREGSRPAPSLRELILFRGIRSKARLIACDRRYWEERGWFKSKFYPGVRLNPVSVIIADLMEWLMGAASALMIKRLLAGVDLEQVATAYGIDPDSVKELLSKHRSAS